ncbi:MAG: hypothetical protein WBA57_19670 [Elainellaceae cyanobacterium]
MAISSFIFLGGMLIYLVVEAFQSGFSVGMRSLCASALPLVAVTYLAFFVHRFHLARNNYLPRLSVYVLSMLWALMLFSLFANLYDSEQFFSLPIVELLFTATIIAFILMYRGLQYATALAASYGLVSGMFMFAILLPVLKF